MTSVTIQGDGSGPSVDLQYGALDVVSYAYSEGALHK